MDCREAGDMTLSRFFRKTPGSSGVFRRCGLSLLLYAALTAGAQVKAYYVKSPFQPRFELEDARRLAEELGRIGRFWRGTLWRTPGGGESSQPVLFLQRMIFWTDCRGCPAGRLLLASGRHQRLGRRWGPARIRALRELSVRSPLRECGLTKGRIRELSEAKLFTWDKPAYACLATRIPTGTALTLPLLERTEGEDALTALGFRNFRCSIWTAGPRSR